jgi:hypothetical protein
MVVRLDAIVRLPQLTCVQSWYTIWVSAFVALRLVFAIAMFLPSHGTESHGFFANPKQRLHAPKTKDGIYYHS